MKEETSLLLFTKAIRVPQTKEEKKEKASSSLKQNKRGINFYHSFHITNPKLIKKVLTVCFRIT